MNRFNLLINALLLVFPTITITEELDIPDPSRYLYNLGIDQLKIGNPDSAMSLFHRSAKLDSTFPWVYVGLANAYYAKGDLESSLVSNSKALFLDSTLVEPAINIGKIYFELGRYPEAINQLKSLYKRYPHILTINLLLGQSYFYLEEYDSAEYYYTRSLNLTKTSPEVWLSIGILDRTKGNYERALFCFQKALEFAPNSVIIYHNIACTYALKGENKKAIDEIKLIIKLDAHYAENIKTDPCFVNLSQKKEFKKLFKEKKDKR